MAATTSSHYIRSIHTSFTAAHPRNSWASAAAAPRYAPLAHSPSSQKEKDIHLQVQQPPHHQATQFNQYQHQQHLNGQHHQFSPPSINTHNSHTYTHHLYALHGGVLPSYPSAPAAQGQGYGQGMRKGSATGAPAGGRRRSASIRMAPAYSAQRGRAPAYKFDPFADEEVLSLASSGGVPLSVTSPLTGSSQANRAAEETDAPLHKRQQSVPYTIHIPAAQPKEIQQYTPPPSPRPVARKASLRSLKPISGPLPGSVTPTAPVQLSDEELLKTNLSKVVARILLTRVHAVGKPMRRRSPPPLDGESGTSYRKSSLSSVVSVEA